MVCRLSPETMAPVRTQRKKEEALLLLILVRRLRAKRKRNRRIWVHETLQKRAEFGEYHTLVRELDSHEDRFFGYVRMFQGQFAEILALVQLKITKTTTNWRKPISPAERLAVCLRYVFKGRWILLLFYFLCARRGFYFVGILWCFCQFSQ